MNEEDIMALELKTMTGLDQQMREMESQHALDALENRRIMNKTEQLRSQIPELTQDHDLSDVVINEPRKDELSYINKIEHGIKAVNDEINFYQNRIDYAKVNPFDTLFQGYDIGKDIDRVAVLEDNLDRYKMIVGDYYGMTWDDLQERNESQLDRGFAYNEDQKPGMVGEVIDHTNTQVNDILNFMKGLIR